MYGSDASQHVPSLYTKVLSPLCDTLRVHVEFVLLCLHNTVILSTILLLALASEPTVFWPCLYGENEHRNVPKTVDTRRDCSRTSKERTFWEQAFCPLFGGPYLGGSLIFPLHHCLS